MDSLWSQSKDHPAPYPTGDGGHRISVWMKFRDDSRDVAYGPHPEDATGFLSRWWRNPAFYRQRVGPVHGCVHTCKFSCDVTQWNPSGCFRVTCGMQLRCSVQQTLIEHFLCARHNDRCSQPRALPLTISGTRLGALELGHLFKSVQEVLSSTKTVNLMPFYIVEMGVSKSLAMLSCFQESH